MPFESFLPHRCLGIRHLTNVAGRAFANARNKSVAFNGPVVASCAIVPLLKIQRAMDQAAVFTVSGRLDGGNVRELCQLIDAEPHGNPVVVDLTNLVLADREAIRYLRDCETGDRVVLRNCPEYVRVWMSADERP
jgi:hypothetical protein